MKPALLASSIKTSEPAVIGAYFYSLSFLAVKQRSSSSKLVGSRYNLPTLASLIFQRRSQTGASFVRNSKIKKGSNRLKLMLRYCVLVNHYNRCIGLIIRKLSPCFFIVLIVVGTKNLPNVVMHV